MNLADRFGGMMGGKMQQRIVNGMFKNTGLVALTEGQRISATGVGMNFVRRLVQDVTDGHRVTSSKGLLNELGIEAKDVERLRKWIGDKPSITKLGEDSPEAAIYRNAVARFVEESVQGPRAIDRPMLANHPVGRMTYSLTSFQYAFARNVLFRTAKLIKEGADPTKTMALAERAQLLGVMLPMAMLFGAQMGVSRMREQIYNPGTDAERDPMSKHILDISRSGITGALDPLINAFASVKYDKDFANIPVGAALSFFLTNTAKITGIVPSEWGGKNNENTNNAEWAATRAAYQMIAAPLGNAALSMIGGGPYLRALAGAAIAGPKGIGAPQTSRAVADAVNGPRDVSPRGSDAGGRQGRRTRRSRGD